MINEYRYSLSNSVMSTEDISKVKLIELGFIDELKRIKVFEKECPALNQIMVYDIKLNSAEDLEDYVYASNPDLQYNLRKGLTIAEIYDQEDFDHK